MSHPTPLDYSAGDERPRKSRVLAIVAFFTALFAPLIAGGGLYLISMYLFDIDDTLPRGAAILFVTVVAVGVPLAAGAAGLLAAARLDRGPYRILAKSAVIIGGIWSVATLIFLSMAIAA